MKKSKLFMGLGALALVGGLLVAADHIDAPGVTNTTADIADFYAFEPTEGSDNTVFAVDLQTNVLPDLAYGTFDENVLMEINIDRTGDLVEDLVIQAIPRNGKMYFFGPVAPSETGLNGTVMVDSPLGSVDISAETAIVETTADGVSLFAGPRQDAFFFDFFQFNEVIGGTAPLGFKPAGDPNTTDDDDETAVDTFDGANTMSIVIEIPNSMLGETTAVNVLQLPVYKTWVTTNVKQ
ncbi:protein of unknown function [Maribacter sedimenticola]|uniref:DUF4331 domain-containing protein n=1 Tax=Maribacter sedimenticola TaxID=228956 RepID=A0ABY1SGH8_9FLAO|nr:MULTISPECIES: DUF4331 family protein [Maribacter]TVZ14625.1 uncharacterized protein DUF4331 [Maribacter sp. MAR_2009_72]SNR42290.1 protein of unknown function [Maribacter sedimenticola]